MFFIYISILSLMLVFSTSETPDPKQKRILVNDQSYVQSQLDRLQIEIQTLQVTLGTQQKAIADLQTEVTSQKSMIVSQESNITSQKSTIQSLQNTIKSQEQLLAAYQSSGNGGKGTYYTIWGKTTCPTNVANTELYSGYAGGSHFTSTGAAAEYVCMTPDPQWGPHEDAKATDYGYIYGAEYEGNASLWGMENLMQDVPCAVCETANFSMTMMLPGRTQCYPGWTEAYHGDLASGASDQHAATQYVCVAGHPEALVGGGYNDGNGKLFYPVRVQCGSLKCPPYHNDKLLSCVVCLK